MSAIHVAQANKGDQVKAITPSIAGLEMQAEQGRFAQPGTYPYQHSAWCREEIKRQRAEINRLGNLSDEELVEMFCPEVAREKALAEDIAKNGEPSLHDIKGRGPLMPQEVVVSRTPRPVRREGGDPSPVAPGQVPS